MRATHIPKIRSHKHCQQKSHDTHMFLPTQTLNLCVCGLNLLSLS